MCHLDRRRFPIKINWTCNLDSDVAGSSKDIQRIEPKPKPNCQVQGDPYVERKRKSRNVPSLIATLLIKRNMIMSQIQQVRWDPYVDQNPQSVACWHLNMLKEIKQVRRDPSRWIIRRNTNIDFRVPGLLHSVVKEAEHIRVQVLVQRIENNPHREALHADLQQNSVYNPFSENSKAPLQAHRGGTSLNGIGNDLIFFKIAQISFLLQLGSFTVDSNPM